MGSDFFDSVESIQADIAANVPPIGIGRDSIIRRAIIDKNVRIGKNVRLLNEKAAGNFDAPDGAWYIREGVIIIPKNGVIPDNTVV
jgi:glucose-1-phosphate adenylyltransferase